MKNWIGSFFGMTVFNYFPITLSQMDLTCSDHSYVLLNTAQAHLLRKGTAFKYQHSWTCYHETHTLVRKNWNAQFSGTPMFRLAQKLKRLKLDLKSWSKRTFENFKHKLERNAESLLRIEQRLVLQPHSARLNNWHFRLVKSGKKCIFSTRSIGVS